MNVLETKSATPWRSWLVAVASALLMAACGGGGSGSSNAGTCSLGCTPDVVVPPTADDMTISLSAATMPNTVSATVEVTITTVDKNRATVAKIPVSVSVDSGATINVASAVTDSSGQMKGVVALGGNTTPRKITVTAVSGTLTKTAVVEVTGTTSASDLTLVVAPALHNTGVDSVVAVATAVDSNRAALAGVPIILSVNNGAIVKPSSTVSDSNGQVSGTITIGEDKTNRSVTVTATSGGLTRTAVVQVTGTKIKSTLVGAILSPGASGQVQYTVTDFNGIAMAGVNLVVTGPNGVQSSGLTDATGAFKYAFIAPVVGGEYPIRASVTGVEDIVSVLVNAGIGFIPAAVGPVQSASVSASPSVIPTNTPPSEINRASVRALFLRSANAPVKNVRVRFDLNNDPQSIGGTFSTGNSQVLSDDNGVATTSYIAGSRSSPTDGVTVRACWALNDFLPGQCPNEATATLTVAAESLSVSIGTGNEIVTGDSGLTYIKRYAIQVVNSSGVAAQNVQVSATVDLLNYYKGFWSYDAAKERWVQNVKATCGNEDLNRNGVSETLSNGVVEDANGSFNRTAGRPALEPRKADVAVSFEGDGKTNTGGVAVLRIEYPQNVASWDYFNIVVNASGVSGTEGRANFEGVLPVPAPTLTKKDVEPPFSLSPYGVKTSPLTLVQAPGVNRTVQLCTEPD